MSSAKIPSPETEVSMATSRLERFVDAGIWGNRAVVALLTMFAAFALYFAQLVPAPGWLGGELWRMAAACTAIATVAAVNVLGTKVGGSVQVAGLSLDQAAQAIRYTVAQVKGYAPEKLLVVVDVAAYNSKRYYVITDGAGYGEQVFPFPITGSETVLDAIGNVNGLHAVAQRR